MPAGIGFNRVTHFFVFYLSSLSLIHPVILKDWENIKNKWIFFQAVIRCNSFSNNISSKFCVDIKKYEFSDIPAGIYLLKVNNRNTRIRCETCSKLTIKIPERRQFSRFDVNFVASLWYFYC